MQIWQIEKIRDAKRSVAEFNDDDASRKNTRNINNNNCALLLSVLCDICGFNCCIIHSSISEFSSYMSVAVTIKPVKCEKKRIPSRFFRVSHKYSKDALTTRVSNIFSSPARSARFIFLLTSL